MSPDDLTLLGFVWIMALILFLSYVPTIFAMVSLRKPPKRLPVPSLWDSVYVVGVNDVYDHQAEFRRLPWHTWKCSHAEVRSYVRIDHRAGSGSFADNYRGRACARCSKIFQERAI